MGKSIEDYHKNKAISNVADLERKGKRGEERERKREGYVVVESIDGQKFEFLEGEVPSRDRIEAMARVNRNQKDYLFERKY